MTVLIVDDDIPTTQVLEEKIDWNLLGVDRVCKAYNANSARQMLDTYSPELVLTDIEMPQGSGIELLQYAREKKFASQFIILTCHENFHYASQALHYEALDYLVKPIDLDKMQLAVAKALERITYQKSQKEGQRYKEEWLNSAVDREKDFWRELLFALIPSKENAIRATLESRKIDLPKQSAYTIILAVVKQDDAQRKDWDAYQLAYALSNILSEKITEKTDLPSLHYYVRDGRCGAVLVLGASARPADMESPLLKVVEAARNYLQCEIHLYYKDGVAITELSDTLLAMQDADRKNISVRSTVLGNEDLERQPESADCDIPLDPIEKLLREERGAQAIGMLREELEKASSCGRLTYEMLHRVREDYLQLVYSILYSNHIQAHELFSDAVSQKLFRNSENSVFDMMRWASAITEKMLSYQKEMRKTESVIDMIKSYIAQNYDHALTRHDIAASVYLSPDYVAKIFKAGTGMYLKDYLNDVRIHKAKILLLDDSYTVSEVATMVGMDNFSYFSTLFKKNTGYSPREYKQKAKTGSGKG